jgi:hypothetical protein
MASARLLAPDTFAHAIYHCYSRVVDRRMIFREAEKEQFLVIMRLYERLCGVRVLTHLKMLKQRFSHWYNRRQTERRTGTLWEGRYGSVLVESGDALQSMAQYIDLNPLRAGLVEDPKEYRWCGYAEAVAGQTAAAASLTRMAELSSPALAQGKLSDAGILSRKQCLSSASAPRNRVRSLSTSAPEPTGVPRATRNRSRCPEKTDWVPFFARLRPAFTLPDRLEALSRRSSRKRETGSLLCVNKETGNQSALYRGPGQVKCSRSGVLLEHQVEGVGSEAVDGAQVVFVDAGDLFESGSTEDVEGEGIEGGAFRAVVRGGEEFEGQADGAGEVAQGGPGGLERLGIGRQAGGDQSGEGSRSFFELEACGMGLIAPFFG